MARRAALVTGGSRGIGAETCLELARRGFDIAFTYRNKAGRAEAVAAEVRLAGREALAVQADSTSRAALAILADAVGRWTEGVDALVLNASGGLERDLIATEPAYPTRINRDAQLWTLDALLPRLRAGATVVHVTSHWAHRYGEVPQLPAYEPVARSKHAGEQALRERIGELAERGVRLVVVSADLVEGTITARPLERRTGAGPALRAGSAVTAGAVASAIADAIEDPALASGATVVVGAALESLTAEGAPS